MHAQTGTAAAGRPGEDTPEGELLRSAIEARDLIAEAKRLVMTRHDLPADEAFELLRHYSRTCDRPLRDVALKVVRGTHEVVSRTEPYVFTTRTPMPLQMDGEVHEIDAGAEVSVRCARRALSVVR